LAQHAPRSGYAAAADLTARLLAEHARELDARPVLLDPDDLVPITDEADGFSFACGIDAEGGDLAPPGS